MLIGARDETGAGNTGHESAKCRLGEFFRGGGRRFRGADRVAGGRDLDQSGADSGDRPAGLIILVGAFVLSSVALIPDQSAQAFATEVLISGLVMLLAPLSIQFRSWQPPKGVSRARQFIRLVVNMTAGVPVIVAGALLLMSGTREGLHWLAAGIIITLVSAVWNAWVLLVEILR
jgi:hypothetical protein